MIKNLSIRWRCSKRTADQKNMTCYWTDYKKATLRWKFFDDHGTVEYQQLYIPQTFGKEF